MNKVNDEVLVITAANCRPPPTSTLRRGRPRWPWRPAWAAADQGGPRAASAAASEAAGAAGAAVHCLTKAQNPRETIILTGWKLDI